MKVLTKYTKSQNITNVQDVTQQEYLESLATQAKLQAPDDYYNPFSFEDWYNRNTGIISNQEKQQYDLYLKTWYQSRYTPTNVANDLKNDYIAFLKNLTIILNKEDKTNVLNDINWDDPLDVEQVIPLYAKKLKEIAIYLINKREAIKKAKLKYNTTGSNQALEKLFYEYLLKAFTKRDYVLNIPDAAIYTTFPDLSSVNKSFRIVIDELYDDASYFDKNPSLSAADYFSTYTADASAFYDTMNIAPSTYEWFFTTGFTPLCANNPLFVIMDNLINSTQPASAYADVDTQILNEYYQFKLSQKFLGENQYYVSGGYYIPWETTVTYDLQQGNNWFYWPSGEFINDISDMTLDPVQLLSTSLIENGATGFKNYLSADKVFIRVGDSVSGAWLKSDIITVENHTMSAGLFTETTNQFKFPFPGFGVSGEDYGWTGPQFSNADKSFEYLDADIQQAVKNEYWTTTTTNSSLCAISIHDTTLIDNGATADNYYKLADKITIRPDGTHDILPNEVYQGVPKHGWLYKMETTDLPIAIGKNYIHWPLNRYTPSDVSLQPILSSQCTPIALSSMDLSDFIGSRAGYNLFDADIIYKLNSREGTPIECAYLSGAPITNLDYTSFTSNATGIIQNSLSLRCNPNNFSTFIWTDDDTPISEVNLQHIKHQPDCPYLFEDKYSLDTENPADKKLPDYRLWQKCECKAINYSPLGHPGASFDDYNAKSDIIFLDRLHTYPFNKTVWIGSDDLSYQSSEDFAWFQLDGVDKNEPDVGWGSGKWVAGGIPAFGRQFTFKKGCQYKYFRNGLDHSDSYLADGTVPYIIIKHLYSNTTEPVWIKAVADETGKWQSYDVPTDMVINPNDYIVYDHIDSNWNCITGFGDFGNTYTQTGSSRNLTNNRWLNYDFITTGLPVNIAWPTVAYDNGPSTLAFELSSVVWSITNPSNSTLWYTKNPTDTLSVLTSTVGTWVVSVTGKTTHSTTVSYASVANFYISPFLTTVGTSGSLGIETNYTDSINMSWNTHINGWNYTTHSYDVTAAGGRPFWAYASDSNDKITKHKGIDKWGGGIRVIDDYVLITQPEFSDITLNLDNFIDYEAHNNLTWIEPLTFNVNVTSNNWCNLEIDTTKVATLSDYLYNLDKEMIVSGTNIPSNLVFTQNIDNTPIFVNYYANNAFIWTQTLTNSTLGLPPTGGVFVPITSGDLITNVLPYLNFTNRHFPTIATVPHVEELYTTEDVGGYFVPRMLGISTFLSKQTTNELNTDLMLTSANRGISGVFHNIDMFNSDYGLTNSLMITPVSNVEIDSSWMKSSVTEWNNAGMIANPASYQQFAPYQTKYENKGFNNIGIHQQDDKYDPWKGAQDNEWENATDYPTSFKKQYPIDKWYSQFGEYKQLWQWKSDLFGNQYALLKDVSACNTMYEKKQQIGELVIRDNRNIVMPSSAIFSSFYDKYTSLTNNYSISSEIYNLKDFDIWYDTIMTRSTNYLIVNKINFDYSTNVIELNTDGSYVMQLNAVGHDDKFAGSWFFDNEKLVTLATMVSSASGIYPQLKQYDLVKNEMFTIYNTPTTDTAQLSLLNLTEIEDPAFTFNKDTRTYVISFIAKSSSYTSFILVNIYIKDNSGDCTITKVSAITPSN